MFGLLACLLVAPATHPSPVAIATPMQTGAAGFIPAHAPGRPSRVSNLEQVLAQNPGMDPLAGSSTLLDASDLVLFWNGPTPTNSSRDNVAYHTFYNAAGPLVPVTSPLTDTVGTGWAITPTEALSRDAGPDVGGFQAGWMDTLALDSTATRAAIWSAHGRIGTKTG